MLIKIFSPLLFLILVGISNFICLAQVSASLLTQPKTYVVKYGTPVIDGKIDDGVWKNIPFTSQFEDIEGNLKPKPYLGTKVKMLWNDSLLFIAAELKEPNLWANLKNHDDIVFYDNDFEVFIDPSNSTHQYFEIEINALNTIFDLFLAKPYRANSGALISWDAKGIKHQVGLNGTLNNSTDVDEGWTVEMAIPISALSIGDSARKPKEGDIWRINFSRVEWETEIVDGKYVKKKDQNGKGLPENNWVWSPQGVVNMHYPERWGYIKFTKENNATPDFELPAAELAKQQLYQIYYLQQAYFRKNNRFATLLSELGLDQEVKIKTQGFTFNLEASKSQFKATVTNGSFSFSIDQESLVRKIR